MEKVYNGNILSNLECEVHENFSYFPYSVSSSWILSSGVAKVRTVHVIYSFLQFNFCMGNIFTWFKKHMWKYIMKRLPSVPIIHTQFSHLFYGKMWWLIFSHILLAFLCMYNKSIYKFSFLVSFINKSTQVYTLLCSITIYNFPYNPYKASLVIPF